MLRFFAAMAAATAAGCTIVPDAPTTDIVGDTATTTDAESPVDIEPVDVKPDTEPDSAADVPVLPADVAVGPTDVFVAVDAAADAQLDAASDTSAVDAGPTLPPWDTPRMRRWRLAWQDDFNGPPCDPNALETCESAEDRDRTAACYGSRANPVNTRILRTFHADPTNTAHSDERYIGGLANLDKCAWSVAEHVNSRHFLGSAGAIMAYSPDAVRVERGELRITTRRVGANADCGRKLNASGPTSEENLSRVCEYEGGNLMTQPLRGLNHAGDATDHAPGNGRVFPPVGAAGGRLEVRVKAPSARGNLPIISTWPSDGGQPAPEYTLYQHFVDQPRTIRQAATIYGSGSAATTAAFHTWDETQPGALQDEFHVVGVSWEPNKYVEFDLNQRRLARVASGTAIGAAGQCLALTATANPVHLAIRSLIAQYQDAPNSGPEGGAQMPDTLRIDWVRWWEPCDDDDDQGDPACVESTLNPACRNPCDGVGVYEDGLCFVGQTPEDTTGAVSEHYIGYRPGTGITPCTRGGLRVESICALVALPSGRAGTIRGDRMYIDPTCEPTAALVNCGQPCPVAGSRWVADKEACFFRSGIEGTSSFVYANTLYYARIDGNPDGPCPFGGSFDGANCGVGSPPAGFYALTFGNDYYLRPYACPDGGVWNQEQKSCLIKAFPAGTNPFVYAGGIYYPSATAGTCAQGGTFDGANCRLRDIPPGARAFADGSNAYFRAECGPSTNWSALQDYPGASTSIGVPCP